MSAGMSLLMAIVISLCLSAILVYVLSTPLRRVLDALCTSGEASQFWVAFTAVMLFIAPLVFSIFALSVDGGLDAVRVMRSTLLATLLGASTALLVVGFKIAGASPRATTGQH
jgi:hypothetical protein